MIIKLVPLVSEGVNIYVKKGNTLTLNGKLFDFSPMKEGDTLPNSAIDSELFTDDLTYENGHLVVSLRFDIPPGIYSPQQAFPEPLIDVPDGLVSLPQPLPPEPEPVEPELPQDE